MTTFLNGARKVVVTFVAMALVVLLGCLSPNLNLPQEGLETCIWAIVYITGLYMGGNGLEHYTKRPPKEPSP
jgi:hypothetical protein